MSKKLDVWEKISLKLAELLCADGCPKMEHPDFMELMGCEDECRAIHYSAFIVREIQQNCWIEYAKWCLRQDLGEIGRGKRSIEMNYKVFISYSTSEDDASAIWRLQAIAALEGITVYVPSRNHRDSEQITEDVKKMIDKAHCIILLLSKKAVPSCNKKMNKEFGYALQKNKFIVYLVEKGVKINQKLTQIIDKNQIIQFDRNNPIQHKKQLLPTLKNNQHGILLGWLIEITIGLFALKGLTVKII